LAELQVSITTRFQIIRVYAQSVPSIHGQDGLNATPEVDWSNCIHSWIRRVL